jgi:hypothetical protein
MLQKEPPSRYALTHGTYNQGGCHSGNRQETSGLITVLQCCFLQHFPSHCVFFCVSVWKGEKSHAIVNNKLWCCILGRAASTHDSRASQGQLTSEIGGCDGVDYVIHLEWRQDYSSSFFLPFFLSSFLPFCLSFFPCYFSLFLVLASNPHFL